MSYFKKIQRIDYEQDGMKRTVTDITSATLLKRTFIDDAFVFRKYATHDGQLPEMISDDLYKTPDHHWLILMVNNIVDPFTEWAIPSGALYDYSEQKYVNHGGAYGIHHFDDLRINRVCDDVDDHNFRIIWKDDPDNFPSHIRPITNFEYESGLNQHEDKREVIVVHPIKIEKIVSEFEDAVEKIYKEDRDI